MKRCMNFFITFCMLFLRMVIANDSNKLINNNDINVVFTKDEVKFCTRIRTPSTMYNPDTGSTHVIARCCGKNMCSGKTSFSPDNGKGRRLDNDKDAMVIMKTSTDGGLTWKNFQTVSPKGLSHYTNGAGIYDKVRKRLVVQYNFVPGGNTAPVVNTTTWQIFSSDDGKTWTEPKNLTPMLKSCNPNINDMEIQTAGSKVQTETGRIIFAGHDHASNVCVWYSDDGGETYQTSKLFEGNEVSIAILDAKKGSLYMNGRGGKRYSPHRTDYYSYDNGKSWTAGTESQLKEDSSGGCEGSVLNVNNVLYFMEPVDKKRTKMVMHCSRDQGKTWNSQITINGDQRGGYSDMIELPNGKILAVWEDGSHPLGNGDDDDEGNVEKRHRHHHKHHHNDPPNPDSGNFYSSQINTTWCQ